MELPNGLIPDHSSERHSPINSHRTSHLNASSATAPRSTHGGHQTREILHGGKYHHVGIRSIAPITNYEPLSEGGVATQVDDISGDMR